MKLDKCFESQPPVRLPYCERCEGKIEPCEGYERAIVQDATRGIVINALYHTACATECLLAKVETCPRGHPLTAQNTHYDLGSKKPKCNRCENQRRSRRRK